MIGSVVVVREGHSGRGAGRHAGAVLGMERVMLSCEEGWWLGVVWSMRANEGTENTLGCEHGIHSPRTVARQPWNGPGDEQMGGH